MMGTALAANPFSILALHARRQRRRGRSYQPRLTFTQALLSWIGSLLGIEMLTEVSKEW